MDEQKQLSPSEYFEVVKSRKQTVKDEDLQRIYDNCLELLNKYKITGQIAGMRKLLFHLETIEAEREIVKMGITTFVYRDDIEEYIDHIAKDTVKIIELERYEREIPDEIVDVIRRVKDKFDQLYVVFTDYTGRMERQVEKERREKDPILFGTFQNQRTETIIDRFYFLGDWQDEYCDLTLDKMVNETIISKKDNIVRTINTPEDIEELKKQLNQLVPSNDRFRIDNIKKRGVFTKIRNFFSGEKWWNKKQKQKSMTNKPKKGNF